MFNKGNIKLPTRENIEAAIKLYNEKLPDWKFVNEVIKTYISEHRSNIDIHSVAIKVNLINSFYYTRIFSPVEMIYHIKEKAEKQGLDDMILNGDLDAVNLIISGARRRYLSFASKYCHFHNLQKYPIFDKYVRVLIKTINSTEKLLDIKNSRIDSDYIVFCDVVLALQKKANLLDYDFDQLDKYLWLYGQKISNNNFSREVRNCFDDDNNKDLINKLGV